MTAACPVIVVQRGVPFPPRVSDEDRSLSDIIMNLKKGESFLISPALRSRVLMAAGYMARTGKISFSIKTRKVNEGGIEALRCWRVEE